MNVDMQPNSMNEKERNLPETRLWFLYPIFAFVFSRCIVLLGAIIGVAKVETTFSLRHPKQLLLEHWMQFDAQWYMNIVMEGYSVTEGLQSNVAFFPTYPYLIRYITLLFYAEPTYEHFAITAIAISNICFLLSLFLLYRLVAKEMKSPYIAKHTIFFLALYPFSFFFSAAYSESLFLLLGLLSAIFYMSKHYALGALFGALHITTRIRGFAIGFLALATYLKKRGITYRKAIRVQNAPLMLTMIFKNKKLFVSLLCMIGVMLLYMLYLHVQFGDPFIFISVQKYWGRENLDLIYEIGVILTPILQNGFADLSFTFRLLNIIFAFGGLALVPYVYKYMDYDYALYAFLLLATPLLSGFGSFTRYTIVIFPLFVVIACMARALWLRFFLYGLFSLSLFWFTYMFVQLRFVG